MRAFLAAALLAAPACDGALAPPASEPRVEYRPGEAGTVDHAMCLLGFTAVPLRRSRTTGHHLVEATLNGRPALFVLDTGANLTVLDEDHVRAFGLDESGARRGSGAAIGGAVAARQHSIDSLTVGGIDIRQRRIVVADLGHLTSTMTPLAGGTVHGLIGQDVLNEHRAVIDMAKPLLYLIEADEDPAPVPAERCRSGTAEAGENALSASENR